MHRNFQKLKTLFISTALIVTAFGCRYPTYEIKLDQVELANTKKLETLNRMISVRQDSTGQFLSEKNDGEGACSFRL